MMSGADFSVWQLWGTPGKTEAPEGQGQGFSSTHLDLIVAQTDTTSRYNNKYDLEIRNSTIMIVHNKSIIMAFKCRFQRAKA